ncbi:MAG: hypothetical protein IKG21_11465 [Atopobiaceae bacterium]|nr:hypothetical protein [Atopobiaceae bacterium]
MSERDWEREFEDFDWSTSEAEATNGAKLDATDALDADLLDLFSNDATHPRAAVDEFDADLLELFSGFDSIHAEDDLQAATLGVIFAQVDDEEPATTEFGATGTTAKALIDAPMSQAASTKRSRRARQNNGDARARHLARPRRRWVPAFVACLALVIVGIVSWFVPVTSVAVTQDDLSIVLGVNVYGVAVSTKGEGELDKRVIEKANAANARYEDALGKILDAYGAVQNDNGASLARISVDVRSPIGIQTDGMLQAAQRVVQERMPPSNELNGSARPVDAPTGSGPSDVGPSGGGQSDVGPSGSGPSGGEQFYRPVSDTPNDGATSGEHRWGDNRFTGVPNGNNAGTPSNPSPGNNDTVTGADSTPNGQAPSQPEQMDGTTQQSNPEVSHNTDPVNAPLDEGQSVAQAPAQQDTSEQDAWPQESSPQDVSQQNPVQQDASHQEAWPQESAP